MPLLPPPTDTTDGGHPQHWSELEDRPSLETTRWLYRNGMATNKDVECMGYELVDDNVVDTAQPNSLHQALKSERGQALVALCMEFGQRIDEVMGDEAQNSHELRAKASLATITGGSYSLSYAQVGERTVSDAARLISRGLYEARQKYGPWLCRRLREVHNTDDPATREAAEERAIQIFTTDCEKHVKDLLERRLPTVLLPTLVPTTVRRSRG